MFELLAAPDIRVHCVMSSIMPSRVRLPSRVSSLPTWRPGSARQRLLGGSVDQQRCGRRSRASVAASSVKPVVQHCIPTPSRPCQHRPVERSQMSSKCLRLQTVALQNVCVQITNIMCFTSSCMCVLCIVRCISSNFHDCVVCKVRRPALHPNTLSTPP